MKRSISFRSREERTMDRKTFWFLSLFLIDVHLWYPARSPDDCDNSDNSDGNRDDQGCSVTPSEYMSRLS